jgi:hypothetical protein
MVLKNLVFRGPGLQRSWSSEDLVLKVLVLKELVLKLHVPSKVLLSSAQLRVTAKEKKKLGGLRKQLWCFSIKERKRGQGSGARGWGPEARCWGPEARDQRPEARGQGPEARGQGSGA